MHQILEYALKNKENKTRFTLIFANVTPQDILLKEQFDELKAKHPDLAYIHVLEPMGPPAANQEAVERSNDFVGNIRLPRPVIFNTGYERETAIKKAEQEGSLVAFGRGFIANPDFPTRLQKELELAQPDFSNLYFGPEGHPEKGYTDYKPAST